MNCRKTALLLAVLVSVLLMASGCDNKPKGTKFGNQTNGIYLTERLHLMDSMVAEFDTSKYVLEEYRAFLDEEIDAYNESHPFEKPADEYDRDGKLIPQEVTAPIAVRKCEVSNNWIFQELVYATNADFLKYNESTLEKERGGKKLLTGYLSYVDAEIIDLSYVNAKGESVSVRSLCESSKADQYMYIVVDFEANLYGEGELVCWHGGKYNAENDFLEVPAGTYAVAVFKISK